MTLSVFDAAQEAGSSPALLSDAGSVSFTELAVGAHEALAHLSSHGITAETPSPFALIGVNDRASLELLLAAFAIGAPVLLLHPRTPPALRTEQLARWGLPLVSAPPDATPLGPRQARITPRRLPHFSPDDERPLVAIPTSGTSGAPSAVVLSRRAVVASARASAQNLGFTPADRWLLALPVAHVGGLSVITRCLLARRAVVIAEGSAAEHQVTASARHRVTLLSLVPTQVARLLASDWRVPGSVRAILLGGAAASPSLLAAAGARGWPLLTTYGLTEASSQVTTEPYSDVRAWRDPQRRGAGRPLPGIEVAIRSGRVAVRGPILASGLLSAAAGNHCGFARLTPLPLDADGWLLTGDLGEMDADGTLHLRGRADRVLNSGGENVSPESVEMELAALPEVREAAVLGEPDALWGERVVACIAWSGTPLSLAALRERLAVRCTPHQLPRELVSLPALPRLPSGKVDLLGLAATVTARPRALRSALMADQ